MAATTRPVRSGIRIIAGLLALAASTLVPAAELRFRTVEGAGGVPLNVVETGDASKPAILMIHGIGQSYLSFDRQLESALAQDYHLVAFDLRGHGNSGKPWTAEAYKDTAIWAEDVKRVMAATQLVKPVVLGWSYGTAVVADYVRHAGTGNLSGIVLVASLGGLTPPPPALAEPRQAAAFAANRARQASPNLQEQFAAAHSTAVQLTARPMPPEWQERALMMMSMLPGHIRPLLWEHPTANTDLVAKLDVPLLLIGGAKDPSVSPPQATQLAAAVRDGRYVDFESAGHSPFAEEPERFNRELGDFARHAFGISRGRLAAGSLPPGIADPDAAMLDPQYRDPVFWWRMSSMPRNVYEPDPYFYWPVATIHGAPGPFLPAAKPRKTTVSPEALEAAATWARNHGTYALIIVHRGVVQLEQYFGERGKPDELTNGRALTRSVTHMLLGLAVADGKLSLEDPLSRYITEWKDDPRGRITVRQLAQNVSGLEVARQLPPTVVPGNKDLCLAYCGDVVRAALNYPATTAPGTRFEMAQENFQLVGLLTERATGKPLAELLSERIWKKIGASDAALQLDRPDGVARVMCCMRARPRDWARLGMLILQDGRWGQEQVLPAGWVKTMSTPSARNPSYGLGLWLGSPYVAMRPYFEGQPGVMPQAAPFEAPDVRMMEGGGYRTVWAVPSRELMILRLGEQVPDWDHSYLVNTVIRGMRRR